MALRVTAGSAQRRGQSQSEHLYKLGVQGRKTGVTLEDTGVRDEHGLEPIEHIFSSPQKAPAENDEGEDTSSDGEGVYMDIENTTAPDPASLLNVQHSLRMPLPKGRSPVRTYLQSPARLNPNLGPTSSPVRGSIVTPHEPKQPPSVKRRLDFSLETRPAPAVQANGARANGAGRGRTSGLANGHGAHDYDDEAILQGQGEAESNAGDEPMLGGDDDDIFVSDAEPAHYENEEEEEEEEAVISMAKTASSRSQARRGKVGRTARTKNVSVDDEAEEPAEDGRGKGKKRSGPARTNAINGGSSAEQASPKRRRSVRNSNGGDDDADEDEEERNPKRPRTEAKIRGGKPPKNSQADEDDEGGEPATKAAGGQPRARKRKSSGVGDTSVAAVPRGPPLPRSRGLVISRREVPGDSGVIQTRSGRSSFRPLAFWRNEHVDYDREEAEDVGRGGPGKSRFVLPTIKEIHRVDELEPDVKKRRGRPAGKGKGKGRRRSSDDEDDSLDPDPWEEEVGEIHGQVAVWYPEHELHPPAPDEEVDAVEEQIALSAARIETRDVHDATFRFSKTLSLPFMGAGVIDLPPGAVKRPKNSRKMHMVFFVHSGKVVVTVNDETFGITKGGMWFVPRGNYYSIENDYDRDARVFFAQGCELSAIV